MTEPTCPCAGRCHHNTHPCSLGCWAAQKPGRPEEAAIEARRDLEQRLAALEGALWDIVERMANFDYDGVEAPHPGVVASWRDTLRLALLAPHDATTRPQPQEAARTK